MSTKLATLEDRLRRLTPSQIPGAVLLASTPSKSCAYTFATGSTSLDPATAHPLTAASEFWLASCTKLLTSIAALQIVERGLITLDEPVVKHIPELKNVHLLTGFSGDDKPQFSSENHSSKITLRMLLTHTSGMAYDFLSPDIIRWSAAVGIDRTTLGGDLLKSYTTPLINPPATQWVYSPAIDFAGLLVERLTSTRTLGEYLNKHVLAPLSIKEGALIFRAADKAKDARPENWVYLSARLPTGNLIPAGSSPSDTAISDLGGGGGRASPKTYIQVLESLLRNDGKLLRPQTVDRYVFSPQLVDGKDALGSHLQKSQEMWWATLEGGRMLTGGLPLPHAPRGADAPSISSLNSAPGPSPLGSEAAAAAKETPGMDAIGARAERERGSYEYNHSLVGALSRRKDGGQWSLHWSGLPNMQWWVDREKGVVGVMAAQLIPPGDPLCLDLNREFREGAVERLGKERKESKI